MVSLSACKMHLCNELKMMAMCRGSSATSSISQAHKCRAVTQLCVKPAMSARRYASRLHAAKTVQVSCEQAVEELPSKLQSIVKGFQSVPDPRARYQQLLHYAAKLQTLPKEHHTIENKVVGCVSQVWLLASLKEDGNIYLQADSDSALTKGLAALLVEGLSGSPPSAILKVSPDFIQMLGLRQSLTPSRNNGFLNMLKLIQKKTLELFMQSQVEPKSTNGSATPVAAAADQPKEELSQSSGPGAVQVGHNGSGESAKGSSRPIFDSMYGKLIEGLQAVEVAIDDVSHEHAGHAGVHRGAKETHFNVKVVSATFEGLSTIKRHRLVYNLLKDEFSQGLHALSLVTKTPTEIEALK